MNYCRPIGKPLEESCKLLKKECPQEGIEEQCEENEKN